MKYIKIFLLSVVWYMFSMSAISQDKKEKKPEEQIRQYWFVMLLKGPNRNQDSATAAKIQEGHMANNKQVIL